MKIKLLALALLLVMVILPAEAWAATGVGLTPAVQELTLAENQESASFSLTVANTTDSNAELRLSLLDFGALDESGGIAFLGRTGQETSARGLMQWMKLSQDSVTLEPGKTADIEVTVDNDDSLSPGGHYGAVIVSVAGPGSNADSVSVLPAASTLVLLKKTGGDIQELNLEGIKANNSLISLPKNASLRFENEGNTHLVPRGTVEIIGPTGTVVSRGVINETSAFILPDTKRVYEVAMQGFSQPWLPGRYKVMVAYRYDGTEEVQTFTKSYWYMGKLAIVLILILSTVIVLIMYIKYRRRPQTRN